MPKLTLKGNDGHRATVQCDVTPAIIEWRKRHYIFVCFDSIVKGTPLDNAYNNATYLEASVRSFTDAEVTMLPGGEVIEL